jgi:hypothetical protein
MSTLATISGTVTDESGAVVPQATVVAINEATGVRLTAETNASGSFALPGLMVGAYKVIVTKTGFETYTENGLNLHPAIVTPVNPVLKVGATTTEVTVTSAVTRVQTATPELSTQVGAEQVQTLPLNGRNYASLSALMPGVTNMAPGAALNVGYAGFNSMSINGMSLSGTLYTLDGVWNMNTGSMEQTTITPSPDTIEEVRVLQDNYGVQYSLFGANVVLLQTRSGTDKFHGTAFEYLRNDALDSRNFFNPTVSPLKQNIFGFTFAGPIRKKKTFFFVGEQFERQVMAQTARGATPTQDMRNGIFNHEITDPTTGEPFPTNGDGNWVIPSDRLNTGALALLNAQAQLPNNTSAGFLNFINNTPLSNPSRQDMIKVDHNFRDKIRLMVEYFGEWQTQKNSYDTFLGSPFTTSTDPITTRNQLAQIQLTTVLSSNMVNTISVAMNNYVAGLGLAGIIKQSQVPDLHMGLPFTGGFGSDRLPEVDFAGGWPSIGVPYPLPLDHAANLEDTLTDDWSWLRGKHYIQGGMNIVLGTKRQTAFAASNGDWFFSGQFTGDPIADYLLGDAASLHQQSTEARPYAKYPEVSPYIQDRWKVNRKLTVTGGVRIMYMPLPHAQAGIDPIFNPAKYDPAKAPIVNDDGTITATASYDPVNGIMLNGQNGLPLNFANEHNFVWAPSVGFAYDLFGDGRTALRGGYGITYMRVPTASDCSYWCAVNYPNVDSITLIEPKFPDAVGAGASPAGAKTMRNQGLDMRPAGMLQNFSLSLEHQFAGNWFGSIAGAGNIGRHLPSFWNINQPLPDGSYDFNPAINGSSSASPVYAYKFAPYQGYDAINTNLSNSNISWNALMVNVRHPVGHDLFLTAAYTWQHGLSESRATAYGNQEGVQDSYHSTNDYGTQNMDVTHVLAISYIWNLPWYRNATGVQGAVLGGWKYSGITTIQSGFALDPAMSVAFQGLATRPDRISASLAGPKTIQQWFNTDAFAQPAPGYFGNAAPGSIRGPGLINFDMAFYKSFRIREGHSLEFRGEFFNIFNHTNFSGVDTTLGSGTFGQVVSALNPRIVEFALRYQF